MSQAVGKWEQQKTQRNATQCWYTGAQVRRSFDFLPVSNHHLNPSVVTLNFTLSHPASHIQAALTSSINASCLPSTQPFSIVCTLILLSVPWYPALHREEAALPLPSWLVRTIHVSSLTPVSLSLLNPDYMKLPGYFVSWCRVCFCKTVEGFI